LGNVAGRRVSPSDSAWGEELDGVDSEGVANWRVGWSVTGGQKEDVDAARGYNGC